uniref:NADH-ubiquinone oxidoreductase chain 6 n=1 Tax=Scolytinae sp. BMNH 1274713 TaxID=1796544 RepID=A0A126TEB2_9CUCU|nr:NADH dehydrogenase subunit 6 [Scolytinae sp. BMNH 1274713]
MKITLLLNCIMSSLFIFLKNPLSKGYMLLLLTVTTALSSSIMFVDSWFGYILFLIMVGGMLVAFIYMTSIASNEKFVFPSNKIMMIFALSMMMLMFFMFKMNLSLQDLNYFLMSSQEMHEIKPMMSMKKIFNSPILQLPILMMVYLLMTLIMVVKMTEFSKGPIRQK